MNDTILSVRHLSKSFGDHEVLRDVDFSAKKGEVISIIGSSGSGKSTLLRCMNHLETPSGGEILYRDRVAGSMMGAYAADLLAEGKSNRVVAYVAGNYVDYDINEALDMQKEIPEYMVRVSKALAI